MYYSLRIGFVLLEIKHTAESDPKADVLCDNRDCPRTLNHLFSYRFFHTLCTIRGFLFLLLLLGLWCVFKFHILMFISGKHRNLLLYESNDDTMVFLLFQDLSIFSLTWKFIYTCKIMTSLDGFNKWKLC